VGSQALSLDVTVVQGEEPAPLAWQSKSLRSDAYLMHVRSGLTHLKNKHISLSTRCSLCVHV
jgi:hypothetical protein